MVGAAGLMPTLAAIRSGRRIALANKETMVIAGDLIQDEARAHGAEIIPVDSEHSAIYQCLTGETLDSVSRLILTASGGPFRDRTPETMASVTREEALNHPNWDMGAKITVDSATMMNKGLEVIEARWLFGLDADRIDVVIHPQSIIHSMVEFVDGSSKAQLGPPDMKIPIQYAFSAPDRWPADHPVISWFEPLDLNFRTPDTRVFPCLGLAFDALRSGPSATTVLNAANEVAVQAFLDDRIRFTEIAPLISQVLTRINPSDTSTLIERLELDRQARSISEELAGHTRN